MSEGTENLYCLPVKKHNGRFIPAEEYTYVQGDLTKFVELKSYLSKHYQCSTAQVEVHGVTYNAPVYEPRDVDDLSYAIVNKDGLPEERHSLAQFSPKSLINYYLRLRAEIGFSEEFPPKHKSYLMTEFIPPKFSTREAINVEGKELITWGEVKKFARAVVVGAPGAGKTTCLRMLALEESNKDISDDDVRLPVYVQLRDLQNPAELVNYCTTRLKQAQIINSIEDFELLASSGRLLLLLDGLDEVPSISYIDYAKSIANLSEMYPLLGLIVSTREGEQIRQLTGFTHVELNPFQKAEITEWLRRRLQKKGEALAEQVILTIMNHPQLSELAGNPLLLALAAGLVERFGHIPYREVELVLRYIDALVEEWDGDRGIKRSSITWLSKERKIEILCRTAFNTQMASRLWFDKGEFLTWEAKWSGYDNAKESLNSIWMDTGICQPLSLDANKWEFSHRIFIDVLAAKYLVERTDNLFPIVFTKLSTKEFANLWRYACGIAQDASHLLRFVLNQPDLNNTTKSILIAQALVDNVSIGTDLFNAGCDLISKTLSEFASATVLRKEDSHNDDWLLEIEWAGDMDSNSEDQLNALGRLTQILIGGAQKDVKDKIASRIVDNDDYLSKLVAAKMRKGVHVREFIDPHKKRLCIIGEVAVSGDSKGSV